MPSNSNSRRLTGTRGRIHPAGFTLIELVMTVTIIGILASIGIPMLDGQTKLARRTEAYVALDATYKAQMAYRGEFGSFAPTLKDLGVYLDIPGSVLVSNNTLKTGYYTLTMSTPWGPHSFQVTATAQLDADPWPDVVVGEFGRP